LQQAFGAHTSLSVGYFGHHGIHELVVNPSANAWRFGSRPTGRCTDSIPDCAPDPRFSRAMELDTKAVSNYNGMVISFQHRVSGWSNGLFQANYTYGHALDEVSNGWQISGIVFARSGLPHTVLDILAPADLVQKNYYSTLYAVLVKSIGSTPAIAGGGRWGLYKMAHLFESCLKWSREIVAWVSVTQISS
jgi:hypothetical protein